jgi:hypothetical protein
MKDSQYHPLRHTLLVEHIRAIHVHSHTMDTGVPVIVVSHFVLDKTM